MEKTSIYTLKSQQHIVGDNLMSSGATGNDISALRDGPSGPLSIGITSLGDYDKFYITPNNPSFKKIFVPSTDLIDNVITSNFVTGATSIPITLNENLQVVAATLNVKAKERRPLTIASANLYYQNIPNPPLQLQTTLQTTAQTRLMINTAHLNLNFKLFYKSLPVFIGADYWMNSNVNNVTFYTYATIMDPGAAINNNLKQVPYTYSTISTVTAASNTLYTPAAYLGNGYNGTINAPRGVYWMKDPFVDINSYIKSAYYYDGKTVLESDDLNDLNRTLFQIQAVKENYPYAPANPYICDLFTLFAGSKILITQRDMANIYQQNGVNEDFMRYKWWRYIDGIKQNRDENPSPTDMGISRYYFTNMYDYVNNNYSVSLKWALNANKQVLNDSGNFNPGKFSNIAVDAATDFNLNNVIAVNVSVPNVSNGNTIQTSNTLLPRQSKNFFSGPQGTISGIIASAFSGLGSAHYEGRNSDGNLSTPNYNVFASHIPGVIHSSKLNSYIFIDYKELVTKYSQLIAPGLNPKDVLILNASDSSNNFDLFSHRPNITTFLNNHISPNQDIVIYVDNLKLAPTPTSSYEDQYAISNYELSTSSPSIFAKVVANLQSDVSVGYTQFPIPNLSTLLTNIFANFPHTGKISIAWSFFDVDFNYATRINKVLYDVGAENISLEQGGTGGILNTLTPEAASLFTSYGKNRFPNNSTSLANGLKIDFNYNVNGASTLPIETIFDISNIVNYSIIQTAVTGNIPGKFVNITDVGVTYSGFNSGVILTYGDPAFYNEGQIEVKQFDITSSTYGYTVYGNTGIIGLSGTYNWNVVQGTSGYEQVNESGTSVFFHTERGTDAFTYQRTLLDWPSTLSSSYIDNYSQVFYLPNVNYVFNLSELVTSIPELNFTVPPDGFNPGSATLTINWYYGDDNLSSNSWQFGLTGTSTELSATYQLEDVIIKDTLNPFVIKTFDSLDVSGITSGTSGSTIANSYREYGYSPIYGITGSEIPFLGISVQDLNELTLDMSSMQLLLTYYYGTALFNQIGYFTLTNNSTSVFNLPSSVILKTNYLPKAQRKIIIPYADASGPLYIVNVRANQSGYTFTQDPIPIRVFNNTYLNYKILKYGYSGFILDNDLSNLIDINDVTINPRSGYLFDYIPGKNNNFNDGALDKHFDKFITTYDNDDFITGLVIKKGVTGFLNDFFVFNNTLMDKNDGYTGTLYVFLTSITGPADPSPLLGSTGLYVVNGVKPSDTQDFVRGFPDSTYGFTNEIVSFNYNNYNPSNFDELSYNSQPLNFQSGVPFAPSTPGTGASYKMRILRNTKRDKYDSTQPLEFLMTDDGVGATAKFYGLTPNTVYQNTFLTYDQGGTGNTSSIINFSFETGSTGIIFNAGLFNCTPDPFNDRRYVLDIENCSYTKKPGTKSRPLPDGTMDYRLLVQTNESPVQILNEEQVQYTGNQQVVYHSPFYYDDLMVYDEVFVKNGSTYGSTGFHFTSHSQTLNTVLSLGIQENIYFNDGTLDKDVTPINFNYNKSTLYVKNKDSFVLAPLNVFDFIEGYTGTTGRTYYFTNEPINTTGNQQIDNIKTDMQYSLNNLKRGVTYYPKLFMQLRSDGKYLTNCVFANPFTVPKLPPVQVVLSTRVFSYKKVGVIKNFHLFFESKYGDLSFISDRYDFILRIISSNGTIMFQQIFPKKISKKNFPLDIDFEIYGLTPSASYSPTEFKIVCAHADPGVSPLLTDQFKGITGLTDVSLGGKILSFGDHNSTYSYLNNQLLLTTGGFTAGTATDLNERITGAYSVVPHTLDTVITLGNFTYYRYEPANSYPAYFNGGKVRTYVSDSNNNQLFFVDTQLVQTATQAVTIVLNKAILDFNTKYNVRFQYLYTNFNGVDRVGTAELTNSFLTPSTEVFDCNDVSVTPLVNKIVIDVGQNKNIFADQSFKSLNRNLAVQVIQNDLIDLANPFKGVYIENKQYNYGDYVLSNVLGVTGLYRKTSPPEKYKPLDYSLAATGGYPLNGFDWIRMPHFSNTGPTGVSSNNVYISGGTTGSLIKVLNPYDGTNKGLSNSNGYTGSYFNKLNIFDKGTYKLVVDNLIPNTSYTVNVGLLVDSTNPNSDFTPLSKITSVTTLLNNEICIDSLTGPQNFLRGVTDSTEYAYLSAAPHQGEYNAMYERIPVGNGIGSFDTVMYNNLVYVTARQMFKRGPNSTIPDYLALTPPILPDPANGITGNVAFTYRLSYPSDGINWYLLKSEYLLNNFRFFGTTNYTNGGEILVSGQTAYNFNEGSTFDSLLYRENTLIQYKPQNSIDVGVSDYTAPSYFIYEGSLTGTYNQNTLTHSISYFGLTGLYYSVLGLTGTNIMNSEYSLVVVGNTGTYKKEFPLQNMTGNFALNNIYLDDLTEQTTYSDFKIYYKLGSLRLSDEYIPIPTFTTPQSIVLDYTTEIGVTSLYLTFNSIRVDNVLLSPGKYFLNDGPSQEFKFYFFLSTGSGNFGQSNTVETDYFDATSNNNLSYYKAIQIKNVDNLVTYDRLFVYYRYIDSKYNFQVITKVITLV